MPKVRVYELAKELGVESKTVLSMLKDMGEFVRSASSTVEAPVERRLKEKLASEPPPAKKPAKKAAAAAPAPAADTNGEATTSVAATAVDPAVGQADGSTAAQPAAPSSASVQSPPEARPRQVPPGPHRWTARPRRTASRPVAGRQPNQPTGRPHSPVPQMPTPRPGDVGGSPAGPRPRPGSTGGLPGGQGPAGRRTGVPRPGNNPFSSSQGMGQPRAPRPGAADPAPGLAGRAHRWAVPPCREAGQACPACRGRIRP